MKHIILLALLFFSFPAYAKEPWLVLKCTIDQGLSFDYLFAFYENLEQENFDGIINYELKINNKEIKVEHRPNNKLEKSNETLNYVSEPLKIKIYFLNNNVINSIIDKHTEALSIKIGNRKLNLYDYEIVIDRYTGEAKYSYVASDSNILNSNNSKALVKKGTCGKAARLF